MGTRSNCRVCFNRLARGITPPNKLRIQEYMHNHFRGSKCADCGDDRWQVLQNDHIALDKLRRPNGRLIKGIRCAGGLDRIKAEIGKCEVVCVLCHTRRTAHRRRRKQGLDPLGPLKEARTPRKQLTREMKLASGCVQCGFNDPLLPEALHFDHIDPTQKLKCISHMVSRPRRYPDDVYQAEIAKCQILCAKCHILKTSHDQRWGANVKERQLARARALDGGEVEPAAA